MFRLPPEEANRSQIVTGSQKYRTSACCPTLLPGKESPCCPAFLKSPRAVQVNIAIMRTFVRLRHIMESHSGLAEQLQAIEGNLISSSK